MSGLVARVIGSLLSSPAEERHFLSFQPASNAFWSIPSMITRFGIKYTRLAVITPSKWMKLMAIPDGFVNSRARVICGWSMEDVVDRNGIFWMDVKN